MYLVAKLEAGYVKVWQSEMLVEESLVYKNLFRIFVFINYNNLSIYGRKQNRRIPEFGESAGAAD